MLGYTPAEWQADPGLWRRRLHAEDRDRVLAETARAEERGGAIEIEDRILDRGDEVRWLRHEALVHFGTDGEPGQSEGPLTDITERKAFESQLQFLADHDALTVCSTAAASSRSSRRSSGSSSAGTSPAAC